MLRQNLNLAFRNLAKSPGFTFVVVLTLALGIGANTAIFSVVYAALLRPLPYREPAQLLRLGESREQYDVNIDQAQVSNPDYQDWKKRARTFQSLAAYSGDAFTISAGDEPKNTFAAQVTPSFFSTLGVKPFLGRDFVDGEDKAGPPHVAILSYNYWRSDFAGDSNVVGRAIRLDGQPATIIGVLPRDFEFAPANSAPLWVPLHQGGDALARRSLRWLSVLGRLAPGVTPDQARAEMNTITAQLVNEYPKEDNSTLFVSQSLRETIVGKIQPVLLVLLGAVGFVLLITCANVANLLMTRAIPRRKEFAVRSALGASRVNLFAQMIVESLLLSVAGAAIGLLAAIWGVQLIISAMPDAQLQVMPFLAAAGINLPVFLFLAAVTLVTAILFGLAPGLTASKVGVNEILKDETRGGTSSGQNRFRQILVVSEIAISLVLLIGAGLMLQSLRALLRQNPGFDLHHVLTFSVNLPDSAYPSDKTYPFTSLSALHFEHDFTASLRSLPGVVDVASTSGIPVSGGTGSIRFQIEGRPFEAGREDECNILSVANTYFTTLKIPLAAGRTFDSRETLQSPPVIVVNRAFAKRYFPNEDPLGKRIRFTYSPRQPYRLIAGIVGDTADVDLASPPPQIVFTPNDQDPSTFLSFLVRTAGDPAAFVSTARGALRAMDPQLPLIQPKALEQVADESPSVFLRRYPSYLFGSFALLALALAMLGLYGLISYAVVQRTREIGIRVALGAQSQDILQLVLREGIATTGFGVVLGLAAGFAVTRLMSSLLYGVSPVDGLTFASVAILLLLVALAACAIPARRATRVDPIVALRYE